ncbi:hypothetical protein C5E45_23590 [Nocardia nova]|uniref:DUF6545 domain-containing protein n=2 Tax=Nocardia nova TaxID=37330 RepID=A0A2S6AKQ4_9NOCA|nr:hypothetical protein C5E45_23590 [Nocardia nova]
MAQIVWTTHLVPSEASAPAMAWVSSRRVTAVMVAVAAVMGILFFLAPVHDEVHAIDFDDHYATEPMVVAFLLVYLSAFGWANIRLFLMCRTWLPHARHHFWLRCGLILITVGSLLAGGGYAGGKAIALALTWLGRDAHTLSINVAPALASLGAALDLIGFGLPSLAPPAVAALGRSRARSQLLPLWRALSTAFPDTVQAAPAARLSTREQLYGRVIETRDGLLRLQPYLTEEVAARSQQVVLQLKISPRERPAAVEAARIAFALRAFHAGQPASNLGDTFSAPEPPTLEGELKWLTAVASAYNGSLLTVVSAEAGDETVASAE